ncbi:MAG: hypothetical protein ABSF84_08795 [Acidimicrobiales bacterium]|jgi:hypothetical protein
MAAVPGNSKDLSSRKFNDDKSLDANLPGPTTASWRRGCGTAAAVAESVAGLALAGIGIYVLVLSTRPGNQIDNPFAQLATAFAVAAIVGGGALSIAFLVAAVALWRERLHGVVIMVSVNAIGILLILNQVVKNLLALGLFLLAVGSLIATWIARVPRG